MDSRYAVIQTNRNGMMEVEKEIITMETAKVEVSPHLLWFAGVAFTFLIAAVGFILAQLPGFATVGPMASALLLAIAYRQCFGYPESLRAGIQFSAKTLLRIAIVLYGLQLNMHLILQQGKGLLVRDVFVVAFSILATVWLGKKLKANAALTLLLGIGTGICGAAAIAAVSPIVKAKEEDTALGVGIIALVGTIFSIAYTLMQPLLPLSAEMYGAWSGLSLHEIAHAVLAGAAAGPDGLTYALLAKLGRVLLLVPLCFITYVLDEKKQEGRRKGKN